MPLIIESHDSLPFIESELSPSARAAAEALVQAELPSDTTTLHESIPTSYNPTFSPLIEAEHARIASGEPRTEGVDLSRYEALEAPSDNTDLDAWRAVLKKAYVSHEYLGERLRSLGLLEQFGKNAWLISNSTLEDELKALERQLKETQIQVEEVESARRNAQTSVAGELAALEEGWRKGVGRMIEVEIAAEGLRQEILDKRREDAQG